MKTPLKFLSPHLLALLALCLLGNRAFGQPCGPISLTAISTGFNGLIGIDHHVPTNKVIASVNYPSGFPHNLELIAPNGTHAGYSTLSGLTDELKIATVKDDGGGFGIGGWPAGTTVTGTGSPGQIVRITPSGSIVPPVLISTPAPAWVRLPGETGLLRGSMYFDRTGIFGGDLIAVTTTGGVWRVSSTGATTLLVRLNTHLEGVITVPNDVANFGPWAGKILAGAEGQGRIYSIDVNGVSAFYNLGINPEDFDLIEANSNFFGVGYATQTLWGAGPAQFTCMVGDLLVTQESPGILYHVWWNGTTFQKEAIAQVAQWEHVTFSTAGIVQLPPPCAVLATATAGTIPCFGGTTTVVVSATGGTAPYSGTGTFTVGAGTHTYSIADAVNCTTSVSVTVTQPAQLVATALGASIACSGGLTTVVVSASGGTAPYSGTGTFTVGAGTHNYVVTDANGCTATTSITVSQPALLVASATSGSIACFGGTTTVVVSATGGRTPYSGTGSFTVGAGTHTYVVTDANGCTATTSITVSQPSALEVSCSKPTAPAYQNGFDVMCGFGGNSSTTLSVAASGGTPAYSYSWSGPGILLNGNTANATVTPPCPADGATACYTYTVVVTDANGCSATCTVQISVMNINCTARTNNGNNSSNQGQSGNGVIQSSNAQQHIYICHVPPGNHSIGMTKCLPVPAINDHLNNHSGDHLGPCGSSAPCRLDKSAEGALTPTLETANLQAFPNPTGGFLEVVFTCEECDDSDAYQLRLMDLAGKVLMERPLQVAAGKGSVQLNLADFATGTYMVTLEGGQISKLVQRVVKE